MLMSFASFAGLRPEDEVKYIESKLYVPNTC